MAISVNELIDRYENPEKHLSKSDLEECLNIEKSIDTEIETEYGEYIFYKDNTDKDGNFYVNIYVKNMINRSNIQNLNLLNNHLIIKYRSLGWVVDIESSSDSWDWNISIDPAKFRDLTITNLLDNENEL